MYDRYLDRTCSADHETERESSPPRKRQKRQQTRYLKQWEELPELRSWLAQSRRSGESRVCNKNLEFKHGGVHDLRRHSIMFEIEKSLTAFDF